MAEEAMVHPRASKRRVRLAYGGRARSLRRASRSEVSGGLLRGDALPEGAETRTHVLAKPGRVTRYDYEYERKRMVNIFD